MSEAKDTTQGLDASVAALVGDAAAPAAAPAGIDFESLAAEAAADMMNGGTAPSSPLDPALEEAVANLVAPAALVTPPAPEPVVAAGDEPADLAKAVEKLLNEEAPKGEPSAAEPVPHKIENLDAKIADLADDLIAGELADEQNVLQGEVGGPPVIESAPPPPSGNERPVEKTPEPAPIAEVPSPAPVRQVQETAASTLQPAPIAKPPLKPAAPASKTAEKAAKVAVRHGTRAANALKPHGLKLLQLMSGPLQHRPKYVRDLVGWAAIITMFNASCLWMYVLFFRSAKAPAPTTAVAHEKPKEEAGHGESAGGGGHGEKKDDKKSSKPDKNKKAPPKKEAKKEAAKGHGGGH